LKIAVKESKTEEIKSLKLKITKMHKDIVISKKQLHSKKKVMKKVKKSIKVHKKLIKKVKKIKHTFKMKAIIPVKKMRPHVVKKILIKKAKKSVKRTLKVIERVTSKQLILKKIIVKLT